MDKKVVKFFEDSGCLMTYLLDPRKQPTHLLEAQVKAGAESYYKQLQSGEVKARPNQYPSGVWYEAQRVKYTQFLRDNERLEHHNKIVGAMEMLLIRFKRQRYYFLALGIVLGGLCVYNLFKYGFFLCQ